MSNVTVDPEMKSRIMSAVSKAIKEQNGGAEVTDLTEIEPEERPETDNEPDNTVQPVKKKARRIPIALITSLAASLLVILGVVFFFISYLGTARSASDTVKAHNDEVAYINNEINSLVGGGDYYEATTAADDASDTVVQEPQATTTLGLDTGDQNATLNKDKNYAISSGSGTSSIKVENTTKLPGENEDVDYSQGIGNERIDTISRKLPFDLESTGSGSYTDGSRKEVFFGENGEKVIIVTTYEDTDVMKKVFPSNKSAAVAGTTPGGISVELYYVPFGNVPKLGKGETTDKINAAVFKKNGYKYLIVYSETIAPEVLYGLIDVV